MLIYPRGAVVGNLVNHDPCALEVSHSEAGREFFGRYAHNLEAGSFPSCFATTSAGMNGSSLSGKLFAQSGKSLSSISGAKEMCSTLLLRLGLEGPQSRVFWALRVRASLSLLPLVDPVHDHKRPFCVRRTSAQALCDLIGVEG